MVAHPNENSDRVDGCKRRIVTTCSHTVGQDRAARMCCDTLHACRCYVMRTYYIVARKSNITVHRLCLLAACCSCPRRHRRMPGRCPCRDFCAQALEAC